jgi:hypothetical protein
VSTFPAGTLIELHKQLREAANVLTRLPTRAEEPGTGSVKRE